MFWLSKVWRDPEAGEAGVEVVSLRWTLTMPDREPDWRKVTQSVVMVPQPGTKPVHRRCSVWVPAPPFLRRLGPSEPSQTATSFLCHSFFEVVQRGRMWTTRAEAQEIRAVCVSHTAPSLTYTDACLYYSVLEDGEVSPLQPLQRTPMLLHGRTSAQQLLPLLPDMTLSDKDLVVRSRREEVTAGLPPPHTFYAWIWGPKDARLLYAVHFYHQGAYNPFCEGGYWLLNNGSPWTLTL